MTALDHKIKNNYQRTKSSAIEEACHKKRILAHEHKNNYPRTKYSLVEDACHDDTSKITGFNRKSSQLINCQLSSPQCLSCRLFSS